MKNCNLHSNPTSAKPEDDTLDVSEIMAFDFRVKDLAEIDVEELMNFNIDWDENS